MRIPALLLAAALAAGLPAAAIVTRPDRDDGEYRELASRYASAIALGSAGQGVLIAPRWILTSEWVGRLLRDPSVAGNVRIAGRRDAIAAVILPPADHRGVALVLLREAVANVRPTPPYRGAGEEGKAVVIVGSGATGRIGSGEVRHDDRERGAINTIARVDADTFAVRVESGDAASDLEGAAGPGDEGAPAYIETPKGLFVAGIARGRGDGRAPMPGDWDTYARVSALAPWIDEAMFRAASDEAAAASAGARRKGTPRR